ncbi:MAG: DUF4838 domain-containing protein [Kiritimatiellae bacterium]|nr:DUF4838 domain-containing protein [Kiritimatiellia bacterium]
MDRPLRSIALLAAAAAAAAPTAGEIKIGVIGVDTSHATEFTRHINVKRDREIFKDFRVVAAYKYGSRTIPAVTNNYPKYIGQMKEMGVEMEPSVKDVLAKCDVVLLETQDGREHLAQAREVFASGKRVFIDKPLASDYQSATRIFDEARRVNANFFSCSALRWTSKVQAARKGELGVVRGVNYAAPSPLERTHSRFTWYGIHGFEPLVAVMGVGAESVSCFSNESNDFVAVRWRDGRFGGLRMMRGPGMWNYSGQAFTADKGVVDLGGYEGYAPMLEEILKFFKTGVKPFPSEETDEIFALMAAAEESGKRGGAVVRVDDVRRRVYHAQRAPMNVNARDLTPVKDFRWLGGAGATVALGSIPAMDIVCEDSRDGQFAAQFIASVIEDMTGARLRIVRECGGRPVTNAPAIYIGDVAATRRAGLATYQRERWGVDAHGFKVCVKDGSVYLCGARCDYAATDFAERALAVREYWDVKNGGRTVVKTYGLSLPAFSYSDKPVFAKRDLWPYEGNEWCRVWKNGDSHCGEHHVHAPGAWNRNTNLNFMFTRPEIFALTDDGKRATMPLLCYGNPRTLETYKERILAEIASGSPRGDITAPLAKCITVSQWDIAVFCNCKYCKAILARHPQENIAESRVSFSNVLWGYFTKELAKWAKKELPGWKIVILPYHNTTDIPDGVDFVEEGNVEAFLCTMPGLAMLKEKPVKEFQEQLIRDWARVTGRPVQNWHYICWPAETCQAPFIFAKTAQRHYRDTREITAGSFLNGRYPVDRLVLSAYCWMRLLWNPELNIDSVYDTFADRMFGPAAKQLREIVRLQETGWERQWKVSRVNNRNIYTISYPRAEVLRMEGLFAEAEQLCAGDELLMKRIAYYKGGFTQFFKESAEYAAGSAFAPLMMQKVSQDPVIDGKLDDACWKLAEAQEFTGARKEGTTPKEGTSIRAVWTPTAVTFGMDCRESDMANLCNDGPTGNYWVNDCVEALIDLGGDYGAFGRVIINASGKFEWYDGFKKAQGPEGVRCAIAKNEKSWSIELYVPYKPMIALYKDAVHPTTSGGMSWTGNFIRLRRGDKTIRPLNKRTPHTTEMSRLHTRGNGYNSDPGAFSKFIFREN